MRLIDIEPFENMADATVCQVQVYRSGDGYTDVMNFKTCNIPTVDAVEVVPCGKCTHWDVDNLYCHHPAGMSYCGKAAAEKGFCSFGERRNDNG